MSAISPKSPLLIPAKLEHLARIWELIQCGIAQRKAEGSNQWQDGYPNEEVLRKDILKETGHVLIVEGSVAMYVNISYNDELEYDKIEGEWLSNQAYLVFHRVVVAPEFKSRGLARFLLQELEAVALEKKIFSIKADTNFDNEVMLHLFSGLGYAYCGEVYFRGEPRKAFQKLLK